jgi:DNA-binding CsgD family transcriptional regulator
VKLTAQHLEMLQYLSHGYSNREIGAAMRLTENTVKTHMRKIFDEMQAIDRAHAVRIGFEENLLTRSANRRRRPQPTASRVMRYRNREVIDGRWVAVDAPEHGKYTTYTNWACRCEPCTVANRVQQAKYKRGSS